MSEHQKSFCLISLVEQKISIPGFKVVCLLRWHNITHEPWTNLPQILIGNLEEPHKCSKPGFEILN